MASGDTKTESYLRIAAEGTRADLPSDNCCNTKTQNLIVGVANRIMDVEDEVEEMKNNPDVVDIVATYADLQAYDTSKLTDKDVIRVLQDETHDGESTYYRFDKHTGQFTYIGTSKQYSNFVGTDGTNAGVAGLVPAPATTDINKFLKSDGTWGVINADTVYSGVTTSNSNAGGAVYVGNLDMNQREQADPTTTNKNWKYFWALPYNNTDVPTNGSINILGNVASSAHNSVVLGRGSSNGAKAWGAYGIAIGADANTGQQSVALGFHADAGQTGSNIGSMVAIGSSAQAAVDKAICVGGGGSSYGVKGSSSIASMALGYHATVGDNINSYKNSVALGAYSESTRQGEVNVGLVTGETTGGYNDTAYRVIGGVHDGVDNHDAVTVGQLNTRMGGMTILSITQTAYDNLATKDPNTLYVITGA